MLRQLRLTLPGLIALACDSSSPGAPAPHTGGDVNAGAGTPPAGGALATSGGTAASGAGGTPFAGGASAAGASASAGGARGGEATSGGATATGGALPVGGSGTSAGNATSGAGNAATGGAAGATAGEWKAEFPSFERHELASFGDGYYVAAFDVDRDGLTDVAALSSSRSSLVWFKNPSWERYTISTATTGYICMAAYDIDGDGDLDLALGSEFSLSNTSSGGTVYWAEAPDDPLAEQEWPLHAIDEVPTTHRLRFADLDADGKKELLNLPIFGAGSSAPEHVGAVQLKAYRIPVDPTGKWEAEIIDDTRLEVAHGLEAVDFDGDAAEDILTASNAGVHLFQPAKGDTPRLLGAGKPGTRPDRGSSEVSLGSLRDARFLATIEPWHGTDAVVYTPGPDAAEPWARTSLGGMLERGHALMTADFDTDGYDEIVLGDQNGGGALLILRYVPSSRTWERIEVDIGGVSVIGLDVADFNGDGALDIVAIGGSSNNLVWYENSR